MRWSAFLFLEEGRTFILRGRQREKTTLARTFESGSVGDYLDSLARLRYFDLQVLYRGTAGSRRRPWTTLNARWRTRNRFSTAARRANRRSFINDRGK